VPRCSLDSFDDGLYTNGKLQGNLGDLQSFDQSSAWFRTRGRIDASLHFRAKGELSFHTGEVELFGECLTAAIVS
jgi:hypothetical protein